MAKKKKTNRKHAAEAAGASLGGAASTTAGALAGKSATNALVEHHRYKELEFYGKNAQKSYHHEREARYAAKHMNRNMALGALTGAAAAGVGAAFYTRHRRNKLERVKKPTRSRNGR